jgi:hypothetical protein
MATAVFAETLENLEQSASLIPERRQDLGTRSERKTSGQGLSENLRTIIERKPKNKD